MKNKEKGIEIPSAAKIASEPQNYTPVKPKEPVKGLRDDLDENDENDVGQLLSQKYYPN